MRYRSLAAALAIGIALSGCSDDSQFGDPLKGTSDKVAAQLCDQLRPVADSLRTARSAIDPHGVDLAAASYDDLATQARRVGVSPFASAAHYAADAAHTIAQQNRDVVAGRQVPAEDPISNVLRLQLAETTLHLACAEHGHPSFGLTAEQLAATTTR